MSLILSHYIDTYYMKFCSCQVNQLLIWLDYVLCNGV